MKVKVIHWRVRSWGGAEYLITKVAECLGLKEVYTLKKPKSKNPFGNVDFLEIYSDLDFSGKLLSKLGRAGEYFVWEYFDSLRLGNFDLLFTSGATTRAVITPDTIPHINYCLSPARWLYDLYHIRIRQKKVSAVYNNLLTFMRLIDSSIDKRVDYYISISDIIRRRLWKYLKRDSKILYPPIYISKYKFREFGDFYLYLGRLDKEKGVIEIIKAFEKSGKKLVIAGGKGTAYKDVRKIIERSRNLEYRDFVAEEEKLKLLSECKAVVFNAVNEDFGIVPVEANASGKPCLTVASGFPGIYVKDGVNGLLHDGTVDGIINAVERAEKMNFDPELIRSLAKRFDISEFKKKLHSYLKEFYEDYNSKLRLDNTKH